MGNWRRFERPALIGLFLLAFLPRAVHPVSRPLQWYFRSAQFFRAVLYRDWASTLFSEHPGVTVMWLSGAAGWGWYGLRSLLGLNPPAPLETEGYAFANRVTVGVLPLALVVALGIVWGWHLLRRLLGRRIAWVGALLWALDPFYLANSKALHLDATLSTLMTLSALWMLIYLQERRWRSLVVSATLGGLAILTKVTALFLIPFLGLCFLVDWLPLGSQTTSPSLQARIRDVCLWLLIATIICFALWPSLWVQPRRTLDVVIRQGIVLHVDRAHGLPRFHRGVVTVGDPGAGLYLDAILFRTTFLTLPFSVVGLGAAMTRKEKKSFPLLLLGAFAVFYFVQMTLGSRKESRYMLPVLLVLDVFSAVGMVWWIERARASAHARLRLAIISLALVGQASLILLHFPYFGTLYNELLGGPWAAVRALPPAEFGEGLDLAGQYVSERAGPDDAVVGTQFLANEMVAEHVSMPVYDIARVGDDVDYLIFGAQYTARGADFPRWGELWERTYRFREPAFTAVFDGIPYAWVHNPDAAPLIPRQVSVRLGESIHLVGWRLAESKLAPGDTLLLTMYWQAKAPIEEDYTVFVHLQDANGHLVAQHDAVPVRGTQPTTGWGIGTLVEDPYEIRIPSDAAYGDYALSTGMYDRVTLERLAAHGVDGRRLLEDRIPLTTVQVRPVVPRWRYIPSGVWLAIIAAGIVWPRVKHATKEASSP